MAFDEEKQSLITPPPQYVQQPTHYISTQIKMSKHSASHNGACNFKTFSTHASGEITNVMNQQEYHQSIEKVNDPIKFYRIINLILSLVYIILATVFIVFEVTFLLPTITSLIAVVILTIVYLSIWVLLSRMTMIKLGKVLSHLNSTFKSRNISFEIKRYRFNRRTNYKVKIHFPSPLYVQTTIVQSSPQMYS